MIKQILTGAVLTVLLVSPCLAQSHHVRGYSRADGTYVQPHEQTNPNSTKMDNWSTKGNVNPYTGKPGTVDPYSTPSRPSTPYSYPSSTNSQDDQ